MATLSIGDRVSDLAGSHEGKLVAVDGKTGYVLQSNGVEIDFPLSRLKPWEPPKVAVERTLQGPLRDRALGPAETALLRSIPPDVMAAVARSYAGGGEAPGTRTAFEALPPDKRLEVVRIHLPTLPPRVLAPHMKLVLAVRGLAKPGRR